MAILSSILAAFGPTVIAANGATAPNLVAYRAAFLAADEGSPVTMAHLRRAAHMDAAKRETSLTDAETRGWV